MCGAELFGNSFTFAPAPTFVFVKVPRTPTQRSSHWHDLLLSYAHVCALQLSSGWTVVVISPDVAPAVVTDVVVTSSVVGGATAVVPAVVTGVVVTSSVVSGATAVVVVDV